MHTEGDDSVPPFLGSQGHKIHQSTVLVSHCGPNHRAKCFAVASISLVPCYQFYFLSSGGRPAYGNYRSHNTNMLSNCLDWMLNLLEQSPKPQVLYLSYQCNKLCKLGPLWPRYSFSRGLPSSSSRNILGSCGQNHCEAKLQQLDGARKSNDTKGCVSKLMALKSIGFLLKVGISTRYHGVPNF